MSPPVEIRRDPPLRFVKLDVGPRNVLGLDAIRALAEALAPDEDSPVVVLSGRDDAFCAGLDTKVLAGGGRDSEALLAAMGDLLLAAFEGPTRIVAVCEGHAVAAGAMLLLVSDVRLGAPGSYKIGFTEPRLGMPLPELPALLARERLERRRLHELTVLGRTIGPQEAAEVGFLDEVVTGDLPAEARARGKSLAELGTSAYVGSVRSVRGAAIARLRHLVEEQRAREARR